MAWGCVIKNFRKNVVDFNAQVMDTTVNKEVTKMEQWTKRILVTAVILALTGTVSVGATTNTTLPFTDDFEGYTVSDTLDDTNGWEAQAYTPVVTDDVSYAADLGTKSVFIPSGEYLKNQWDGLAGAGEKVWTDFFIQMWRWEGASEPSVETDASVMFYFNSNGVPVVHNGDGIGGGLWATYDTNAAGTSISFDSNTWIRVTVGQDYDSKNWMLMLNSNLIDDGIGFISNNGGYTSFSIRHARLDDIVIKGNTVGAEGMQGENSGANAALPCDTDGNGIEDTWEWTYDDQDDATGMGAGDDDDTPQGDGRSNQEEYDDGTDPTDATDYAWNLPYYETFDNASPGAVSPTYGWHGLKPSAGSGMIIESAVIQGSQAFSVTGVVTLTINEANTTNVWCQVYVKPAMCRDIPDGLTNESAGFFVSTSQQVYAYHETNWIVGTGVANVPSNEWLGFAMHLDYVGSNWDLFVSTGAYGAVMQKVNTTAMKFNEDGTYGSLQAIVVDSELEGHVDAVALTKGHTAVNVAGQTNLRIVVRLEGEEVDIGMPPYDYADTEDTLDATDAIAKDLAMAINTGDVLRAMYNGWNQYALEPDGVWYKITGEAAGDIHLNVGMGLQLVRAAGRDALAFYPYELPASPAPGGGGVTNVIFGRTTAGYYGWTLLSWPSSFSEGAVADDMSLPEQTGDRIYVYDYDNYMHIKLEYDGANWRNVMSGLVSTRVFSPGEVFWYRRGGTDDSPWAP